jgi:superfamily II DNA or RNA helicase
VSYEAFLATKAVRAQPCGLTSLPMLNALLFGFQREVTAWALRLGRAAIFSGCGTGKSWMGLEWARCIVEHTGKPALILTPLAVAQQFIREGEKLGIKVHDTRASDVPELCFPGIWVANYEQLHRLDKLLPLLSAVVLDESSILKNASGKTRQLLIDTFRNTPYRLCMTATPSPNDPAELGNHAEFLGIMRHVDMLQRFFEHDAGDTGTWVLKGHGRKPFWRWCAQWSMCFNKPGDIGFSDEGYDLPPLELHEHVLPVVKVPEQRGQMTFAAAYEATSLVEQRAVRRDSLDARVAKAAELVNGGREQWLVWASLNDESEALTKAINGAVEIAGSHSVEAKEESILRFLDGKTRVLVTKCSILAWGLNAQCCSRQLFVGADHSFEQWYQAIRRSYRFGQTNPVQVHQICTSADGRITANLQRKREEFEAMHREMAMVLKEARVA